MKTKPVCMTRIITPVHLNSNGDLFGGQLMKWMDEVSFIAARRYTGKKMVTVSVDKISFKKPVPEGSIVEINALVKENNGVKLHIYTEVIVESPEEMRRSIAAEAWFCFASVDEKGHPGRIKKDLPL